MTGEVTANMWKLLSDASRKPIPVHYGDETAVKLIRARLATRNSSFGKLEITEAGRQALSEKDPQP